MDTKVICDIVVYVSGVIINIVVLLTQRIDFCAYAMCICHRITEELYLHLEYVAGLFDTPVDGPTGFR